MKLIDNHARGDLLTVAACLVAVPVQHTFRGWHNLGRVERDPLRCGSALGCRPFDGTDAAVAEPGQLRDSRMAAERSP